MGLVDLTISSRSKLLVREDLLEKLKTMIGSDSQLSRLVSVPVSVTNFLPQTMQDGQGIEREVIAAIVDSQPMLSLLDEFFGRPQKPGQLQFLLGAPVQQPAA